MSNVKSIKIIAAYNPYARIPGTPRDNAYLEVARAVGSWALVPSFGLTATVYELPPPPKGFPVGLTIEGEEAVSWTFLKHFVNNLKTMGAHISEARATDIDNDETVDFLEKAVEI